MYAGFALLFSLSLPAFAGTLIISKVSRGGTDTFGFQYQSGSGIGLTSVTTATQNTSYSSGPLLVANGQGLIITEDAQAAWVLESIVCTRNGGSFAYSVDLANRRVTIQNNQISAVALIECTFTNSRLPTLELRKQSNLATGIFNFTVSNADTDVSASATGNQSSAQINTASAAAGTPVSYDASPSLSGRQNIRIVSLNTPVTMTEAQTSGFKMLAASNCAVGGSGVSVTQSLVNSGGTAGTLTLTPPASGFVAGSTIVCTFVNGPYEADLSVTKGNGVNTVTSGTTTTYTLTVSNAGPDPASGAVVTDVPGAGIACPSTNPVSCTGSGCPAGPLTVGQLTGSGITLGTLTATAPNNAVSLQFECNVN